MIKRFKHGENKSTIKKEFDSYNRKYRLFWRKHENT